jgi:hypothetical protein
MKKLSGRSRQMNGSPTLRKRQEPGSQPTKEYCLRQHATTPPVSPDTPGIKVLLAIVIRDPAQAKFLQNILL